MSLIIYYISISIYLQFFISTGVYPTADVQQKLKSFSLSGNADNWIHNKIIISSFNF